MVIYTCSDILKEAKVFANVKNVNMTDFNLSTTLLNTEYQKLYDKIVLANGANIKEEYYNYNGEPWPIPDDCYHIIGIYNESGHDRTLIKKSSMRQYIKGNYRIENNKVIFDGYDGSSNIVIKYSTLPQTLTAPDEPVELFKIKECGRVKDKGFFYIGTDDNKYYFDFFTETSKEVTNEDYVEQSNRFLDHSLVFDNGKITYNETDVTYIFERENAIIKSVRVSDPYVVINYSDNRSFIFYGFEGGDQLNWYESTGKETYGEVLGFTTNDKTGRGCIWRDLDGEVYLQSFVPDTVLNYPSNTFFQLLILKLAGVLSALNGTNNPYLLQVQIPEAEIAFQQHLSKDNVTSYRMNNDI